MMFLNLEKDVEVVKMKPSVKLVIGIGVYYKDMDEEKLKKQIELCVKNPNISGIIFLMAILF